MPCQISVKLVKRVCLCVCVVKWLRRYRNFVIFQDWFLPPKRFAPSLAGDINAQSSHRNNWKMKTCLYFCLHPDKNINLTFAQQAFIVYFKHAKQVCSWQVGNDLSSPWRRCYLLLNSAAYVVAIDELRLIWVLHYSKFLANPNIGLEFDCIFEKPMKCRFQRCIVHTEMLSTSHAWVKCISVQQICHWNTLKPTGAHNSRFCPFPLMHVDPHSVHQCLGPPHSSRQMIARSVHALPHYYATKDLLVTMGCPKFIPETAPSHSTITTHIWYTHPSTDPTHHPKRLLDPISHFATVHFADRLTDWQMV